MTHDPKLVEVVAEKLCSEDGFAWAGAMALRRSFYRNKATAALDAITAAGCVVVPVEPTGVMLHAADHARYRMERAAMPPAAVDTYSAMYRAMLAARPGAQP